MTSSHPSTPVPTVLEKAEKALPTVIDGINEKIVDARSKACARKSLVLDSKFVQKAKLQAKRLVDRSKTTTPPETTTTDDAEFSNTEEAKVEAETEAVEPASAEIPASVHVSFQSPLAEQLQQYEASIAVNLNAIFNNCLNDARSQVEAELSKWTRLIHDEAKLAA